MIDKHIIRVGISVGDLNGIGIELILKTFEDKKMCQLCIPIVFASDGVINFYKNLLQLDCPIHFIEDLSQVQKGRLNVFKIWHEIVELDPGRPTPVSGEKSFESLEIATNFLIKNEIDLLLTAPINKKNIQSDRFNFSGHTEYLESKLKGKSTMILVSKKIRLGLVTNHIPVSKIAETLNEHLICKKIDIVHQALIQDFKISKPKIAVLSLNPHSGDEGLLGNEDGTLIKPLLKNYQKMGKLIEGPYPADSFFGNQSYKKFDAVVSMYHDQGLVGFKAIAFGEGVNFTAGLSKVRTSPDHGTAFDIAGKGKANPSSFIKSLLEGISIVKNRKNQETEP